MELAVFDDETVSTVFVRRFELIAQADFVDELKRQRFTVEEAVGSPIDGVAVGAVSTGRAAEVIGGFPEFPCPGIVVQSQPVRDGETGDASANDDAVVGGVGHVYWMPLTSKGRVLEWHDRFTQHKRSTRRLT